MNSTASPSPATHKLSSSGLRAQSPEHGAQANVVAIIGPTGVGKSEVAFLLAQRLGGEIISVDSMQVYQSMDIGTAKPSQEERGKVKHHLVDICPVDADFTVAEYQRLARQAILEIQDRGKLPILVGGSGLYLRAVIDDLSFAPQDRSKKVAKTLYEEAEKRGVESLHEELKTVDPEAASRIHPHNLRRIIRALEVYRITGNPFSQYRKVWEKRQSIYDLMMVGITAPRDELYGRVEARVDRMLERGLLEEVRNLAAKGFGAVITAKQALGYKELLDYLEGGVSFDEGVKRIKVNSRHFAKRQLTWFRRDPRIIWFERGAGESAKELADRIESYLEDRLKKPKM